MSIACCSLRTVRAQEGAAAASEQQASLFDLPDPWSADLTLSWQSLGLDGSLQRYYKYHVPPSGFFVGGLGIRATSPVGLPFLRLNAYNLGEDDTGGELVWQSVACPASLRWSYSRSLFFADPTTQAALSSKRNDNAFALNWNLPGGLPTVEVGFQHQQLNEPNISRLGGGLGFDSKEWTAKSAFPVGPGMLTLSFADVDFTDATGFLPASSTQVYGATYALEVADKASVSARWSKAEVSQTGFARDTESELWEVQGRYQFDPKLTISGKVGERYHDQLSTLNAYTQRVNTADLRLRYRFGGLTIRSGVNRQDFERVDRGHTAIDSPGRETTWVSVRGHLRRGVRFSAKYERQDLDNVPAASIPNLASVSPLYRNSRDGLDLRVSSPLGKYAQGYLFVTRDDVENQVRALSFRNTTTGAGVFTQLSPQVSLSVDGFTQSWKGNAGLPLADVFGLNNGLSTLADSQAFTVTTFYDMDPATSLSVSYTKYRGTEGALINDYDLGVAVRRTLRPDLSCGLEWRRYSHDDNDPRIAPAGGLDFEDDLWRVDLTTSF
jgi:predicted porin